MIRPLRQFHRWSWFAIALVLFAIILVSLTSRHSPLP